jgi:hypothetical protein
VFLERLTPSTFFAESDYILYREVIGITEIYPKNCRYLPGKAELQLEGYELFLSESTSPSKRGAALYVNKKLKAEATLP